MSKDSWLDWYQERKVEDAVVDFAKVLKETGASKILDLGCGTGRNTVYLARLGFNVYGFDWSEVAVNATKEGLSKENLLANLRVWDMIHTPYPFDDRFFDGILTMRVIHHTYLDNIKRIANEIERITKPDGILYVEVPTFEKAVKLNFYGMRSAKPEPGTFIPSEGDEIGIPHHHFKKEELIALFPNFSPTSINENYEHYCMTAVRK